MTEEILKKFIVNMVVKAVLARLFVAVPLLGWGPIAFVISHFAVKYGEIFYDVAKTFISFRQIEFLNKDYQTAFDREMIKLKLLERDKRATKEEIEDAIRQAQDRLADFVQHTSVV